ncbi:hypothetical protein EDD11_004914 [Mortierella claussenii]|nr:hypothetical protein EDD11_004914 [Mortierella claussenii]
MVRTRFLSRPQLLNCLSSSSRSHHLQPPATYLHLASMPSSCRSAWVKRVKKMFRTGPSSRFEVEIWSPRHLLSTGTAISRANPKSGLPWTTESNVSKSVFSPCIVVQHGKCLSHMADEPEPSGCVIGCQGQSLARDGYNDFDVTNSSDKDSIATVSSGCSLTGSWSSPPLIHRYRLHYGPHVENIEYHLEDINNLLNRADATVNNEHQRRQQQ